MQKYKKCKKITKNKKNKKITKKGGIVLATSTSVIPGFGKE